MKTDTIREALGSVEELNAESRRNIIRAADDIGRWVADYSPLDSICGAVRGAVRHGHISQQGAVDILGALLSAVERESEVTAAHHLEVHAEQHVLQQVCKDVRHTIFDSTRRQDVNPAHERHTGYRGQCAGEQ